MAALRRILGIVLPLLVIAAVVNDAGRYLTAMYYLSSASQSAADASAAFAHSDPDRTGSWQAGDAVARRDGVEIYGYDLTASEAHVWTRTQVHGTWMLLPIHHLLAHEKDSVPLLVEDEASSPVH